MWSKNFTEAKGFSKGVLNARQILADVEDAIASDTTNNLTVRIIFGKTENQRGELCTQTLTLRDQRRGD